MAKFTPSGAETFIQKIINANAEPVAITNLTAANPAVASVAMGDIAKFHNGDTVTIEGATGDAIPANGAHKIASVNSGTGTFQLVGVDLAAATGGPWTTGLTAMPQVGPQSYDIVSLSNEFPAVLEVAAGDVAAFGEGQLVRIDGTGTDADGGLFVVALDAGAILLEGLDLSQEAEAVANAGTATPIPPADMLKFCLSEYEREIAAADPIDVSTFCGAESLAGDPTPGTITIGGYQDYGVAAYNEWRKAIKDGVPRAFHIILPPKAKSGKVTPGGDILMTITPTGLTESWALGEAASFTGEAVVNDDPTYLMAAAA